MASKSLDRPIECISVSSENSTANKLNNEAWEGGECHFERTLATRIAVPVHIEHELPGRETRATCVFPWPPL